MQEAIEAIEAIEAARAIEIRSLQYQCNVSSAPRAL
jgi:hypothetical protein